MYVIKRENGETIVLTDEELHMAYLEQERRMDRDFITSYLVDVIGDEYEDFISLDYEYINKFVAEVRRLYNRREDEDYAHYLNEVMDKFNIENRYKGKYIAYQCKFDGEIVATSDTENKFDDVEEDLWGYIQTNYKELFEGIQDWDTPDMLEICYEIVIKED